MTVGSRVYIRKVPKKYPELNEGESGVVEQRYEGNVMVKMDNHRNSRSLRGVYYFQTFQLSTQKEETTMDGNYRIARIKFLDDLDAAKSYAYACYDNSLDIGDCCVVKSAHHGFGIGKIVDFAEASSEPIIREIVCKVDFSAYEARIRARERRDELRRNMAARAAKMQELAVYQMLAKDDAEMAAMLTEYSELTNGN